MRVTLPECYNYLTDEIRQVLDEVLNCLLQEAEIEVLIWAGSSLDLDQGEARQADLDIDLWVISRQPMLSKKAFLACVHDLRRLTWLHEEGSLDWFGDLVTLLFLSDSCLTIDIGFSASKRSTDLNLGQNYWIVASRAKSLLDVAHFKSQTFERSTESLASDLLKNLIKIRRSCATHDEWNAYEYLQRARRSLFGLFRNKRKDLAPAAYSRPERRFSLHLTTAERLCLEDTVGYPRREEILRASAEIARHFIALTDDSLPPPLRAALVDVARDLTNKSSSLPTVAVIGVGRMGSQIARRLISYGHRVLVSDLDTVKVREMVEMGAEASDAAQIWQVAKVVLLSLPTPRSAWTALQAAQANKSHSTIVVDLSTNGPEFAEAAALHCKKQGLRFVDAPLSGGPWGAASGSLTVMAGGSLKDIEEITPILDCFAGKVVHVGPQGHGAVAKLIHNMVGEVQVQVFAEAFCLAERLEIAIGSLYECLASGMVSSRILTQLYASGVLTTSKKTNIPISIAIKDQQLLLDMASALGFQPVFSLDVYNRLLELEQQGLDEQDVTSTLKWFETRHGVSISTPLDLKENHFPLPERGQGKSTMPEDKNSIASSQK